MSKAKRMKEVTEEVVFGGNGPAELAPEDKYLGDLAKDGVEVKSTATTTVVEDTKITEFNTEVVEKVDAKKGDEITVFGKLYRVIKVKSNRRLELQEVKPK